MTQYLLIQVTKIAKVAFRALNLCGIASFDMIVQVNIEPESTYKYHLN